jgi:hypothetical protein
MLDRNPVLATRFEAMAFGISERSNSLTVNIVEAKPLGTTYKYGSFGVWPCSIVLPENKILSSAFTYGCAILHILSRSALIRFWLNKVATKEAVFAFYK